MATLTLQRVARLVGGRVLLHDVSLSFRDGSVNLLLGPNGAGKTTLLRVCALLDSPQSGRVSLDDDQSDGLRRHITMVFQNPVLLNRSVASNIAYPLKLRGIERGEARDRLAEAMTAADLSPMAGRHPRSLSGGEAQRMMLARAYVIRPKVLLLDEPSANLDMASKWRIEEMLLDMRDRFGTTVVMTTHDLFQARKFGEVVFFIHKGRVSGAYPVREFFHTPPGEEAARFLSGLSV